VQKKIMQIFFHIRGILRFLSVLVIVCLIFGCQSATDNAAGDAASIPNADTSMMSDTVTPNLQLKTFQTEEGWGYDIFIDGNHYIHQPQIPAIGGKQAFKSEQQARAIGELVANKIRRGIMPPSVTVAEVDSLMQLD
jgi:hypothetical protein